VNTAGGTDFHRTEFRNARRSLLCARYRRRCFGKDLRDDEQDHDSLRRTPR